MRTRMRSTERTAEESEKKTLDVRGEVGADQPVSEEGARYQTSSVAADSTLDELALGESEPMDVATQDGAQEEAEEESVPASEEDGDNAAQEEAEEESVPASEEDGDNAAQEEAEEAAQEDPGLGSEEKMVRVDEPVTDEGSNHSDGEAGPVIEFVRDEKEEEEEEEEVVVARTASVGECKNQYAKALALIQEARDHSQVLALERYISQNIHNLKRGGDMESLFFALSNVKLRDKVQVYNLRFEQSTCPPSLKQDALLDLPILLYTYFRYQLNEEPDGSRERILVSDTRTVLTSIAFHLAINTLLPQLDPRAVGQAKLKENGMSRSAYVEQCKFFSEKVFDLFVDDEMFSAAFPNEPKECLRKLTTDLFAERSDSCFDVPKLRKATEVHTPAKLIQLMNRYLDGSEDEDEDEGEEQYADEDEDEDESPARRRHPRDGSPSAEEDATDGENASSREEDKGQAGMDEEDFGPGPSYQVDDSDQEAWHGHSGGGKGRQVLHDSDNDDDDDEEDQDDDEKGLSSKRGSHKNTKKSAEKGRGSTEKHAAAAAASETPVPGRRKRARHDWTKKETRALIKGIEIFYNDTMKWAKIKKDKKLGPILLARTNGDLKDKFRSMRDSGKYDFSEFSSYLDVAPKQNKRLKCGPN